MRARRYQERTSPSPQGANSTESRSSVRVSAHAANRSRLARSARNCSRLSRRLANGQYGQS